MAELMLVNPARRKRTTSRKKRRTPAQVAATKRLVAANKRRARKPATRRRKTPVRRTASRTPTRRRTYKRNPVMRSRGLMKRVINEQLIPAATEASGAIALDVLFGYLGRFVPAQLQGGMMGHATKVVAAIGMGAVAANFMTNKTATTLARGAITVSIHDAMKETISNMAPQIPLGYYSPAYVTPGMGYYTEDANANLLTPQDQFTPDDQTTSNMGYYEGESGYDTSML